MLTYRFVAAGKKSYFFKATLSCRVFMSIQRADTKDIEPILFVINKSNREAYRNIIPPKYFKEPVLTLDELLKDFECMTFYTYNLEDKVVGVAALKIQNSEVGCIRWVYVLPEHQRKGVGTSLINHIESEAKKTKLKRLRVLYVQEGANWARSFYTKLGYKMGDRITMPWEKHAYSYEKTLA